MALAAAEKGLDEICFTDHVDIIDWQGEQTLSHDWTPAEKQYADALKECGGRVKIRLGVELGQAAEDFSRADRFLDGAPQLDFIIGSVHNTAEKYGRKDFCTFSSRDENYCRECIDAYLDEMLAVAKWGRFSVLGHMTLPLRYMNEDLGLHMTFDGFEDKCEAVFKEIIPKGLGIEINTNRGNSPLPYGKILRQYRRLGGEIITMGSDSHSPRYIGCKFAENAELLRECGFEYFTTFEKMKPTFHKL
jgi:histidinol-phosphatase (PHP family)